MHKNPGDPYNFLSLQFFNNMPQNIAPCVLDKCSYRAILVCLARCSTMFDKKAILATIFQNVGCKQSRSNVMSTSIRKIRESSHAQQNTQPFIKPRVFNIILTRTHVEVV